MCGTKEMLCNPVHSKLHAHLFGSAQVHRDLKSPNLLVDETFTIKVEPPPPPPPPPRPTAAVTTPL